MNVQRKEWLNGRIIHRNDDGGLFGSDKPFAENGSLDENNMEGAFRRWKR